MNAGNRSLMAGLAATIAAVCVIALAAPVAGATGTAGVVPPNKQTAGESYSEWSNRWWQWADSIPLSVSPVQDLYGENCAEGQSGPVWYLAGSSDGAPRNRTCTVPSGKYLFFPMANGQEDEREAAFDLAFFGSEDCPGAFGADVCSNLYDTLDPINGNHMRQLIDYFYGEVFDLLADPATTGLYAKIDGSLVADPGAYRFDSGGAGYTITLPDTGLDNYHTAFGYSIPGPDTYQGGQSGYYIMVEPLSVGSHEVEFGRPGWEIHYDLTIE